MRVKNSSSKAIASHGGMSKRHLKNAMALMKQHHDNVMEYQERGYQLESGLQSHMAGLQEQSRVGSHARNLEMVGAIQKASEGGTEISHKFADGGGVSYTRKKRNKQMKPAATPNFPAVKMPEEPQQEAPKTQPTAKSPKFAQRDPKTGKISGYASTVQKPIKPKKTNPRKRK